MLGKKNGFSTVVKIRFSYIFIAYSITIQTENQNFHPFLRVWNKRKISLFVLLTEFVKKKKNIFQTWQFNVTFVNITANTIQTHRKKDNSLEPVCTVSPTFQLFTIYFFFSFTFMLFIQKLTVITSFWYNSACFSVPTLENYYLYVMSQEGLIGSVSTAYHVRHPYINNY